MHGKLPSHAARVCELATGLEKRDGEIACLRYPLGLMKKLTVTAILFAASYALCPVANAQQNGDCDPNYSGACVPIASDVDCQGGSGNGPAYVAGPVTVVGKDIYDLDRDGNGTGCE